MSLKLPDALQKRTRDRLKYSNIRGSLTGNAPVMFANGDVKQPGLQDPNGLIKSLKEGSQGRDPTV